MVLTTTEREGDTWEKESKRGGRLVFNERIIEYVDTADGSPVVTVRMVAVKTERPVEQEV
jgi:hypothetical protein